MSAQSENIAGDDAVGAAVTESGCRYCARRDGSVSGGEQRHENGSAVHNTTL
ncbi:hypothetical protein SAMN05216388_102151 [Halorientalis persicus]|uniref:Uncharacterized protein n=1 Tax=Halorientalis persicus TaxID=1367881 RepID=A0A1H8T6U8_9EURY|nr:hypothetical protein SAMN05216388_102151 [Halorientalis persicus]